ncbi:uncharacterized protein F5891DRAFT_27788 [Suillus fuscotomentosus]|uniref:Uncharacterized protein n=1 Tax=Suillus fuscotomentosus TaxID=1912939 RepID=A0AAD4EMB4_9AGAM|nr:uncharacterized protein F5891DRAFT_27788 [Suillus fuscotomentosus]KAG1908815.1 hypothetical protein F5891DRAFT_27788 [Suillus fuscotomentosus]
MDPIASVATNSPCDLDLPSLRSSAPKLQSPRPYTPTISSHKPSSPPPVLSSSHSISPPSSPRSIRLTESDSDAEYDLPVTPSSTHPYLPSLSLQEKYHFETMLLRHIYDDSDSLEPMSHESKQTFLKYVEGMSAHSFRCVVHYKEAVREFLRMEYYAKQWQVEVSNRLETVLTSLSCDAEGRFRRAEKESQWLLNVLLDRESLSTAHGDPEALVVSCNESRKAIHSVDDELSVLKCRKVQDADISNAI